MTQMQDGAGTEGQAEDQARAEQEAYAERRVAEVDARLRKLFAGTAVYPLASAE